jgi:thiaminase (transcriptional activator TenA)
MKLSTRLIEVGRPLLAEQLAHPTVVGIACGDLPERVFRSWLEQDYLFLLDYVRVFSRLAWQAPSAHLGDLVDLAHTTWHDELELHRTLSAEFDADLDGATKGPTCAAYTAFLLDAAATYGDGLAALLPCMWGYAAIGQELAANPPADARYRRWIGTYADPGFAALAARCADMLDEADALGLVGDHDRAEELFRAALGHELAFWTVP